MKLKNGRILYNPCKERCVNLRRNCRSCARDTVRKTMGASGPAMGEHEKASTRRISDASMICDSNQRVQADRLGVRNPSKCCRTGKLLVKCETSVFKGWLNHSHFLLAFGFLGALGLVDLLIGFLLPPVLAGLAAFLPAFLPAFCPDFPADFTGLGALEGLVGDATTAGVVGAAAGGAATTGAFLAGLAGFALGLAVAFLD